MIKKCIIITFGLLLIFSSGCAYTHHYFIDEPRSDDPYTMEGEITVVTDQGWSGEGAFSYAMVYPDWDDKIICSVQFLPEGGSWVESYSLSQESTLISRGSGNHNGKYRLILKPGFCLKSYLSEFVEVEYINRYNPFSSNFELSGIRDSYGNFKDTKKIHLDLINLVTSTTNILKENYQFRKITMRVFDRPSEAPIERTRIYYSITLNGNQDAENEINLACQKIFLPFFPKPPQNVKNFSDYTKDSIISNTIELLKPDSAFAIFDQSNESITGYKGSSIEFLIFENKEYLPDKVTMTVNIQAENYKPYEITVDFPNNISNVDIYLNSVHSEYRKSSLKQIKLY